MGTILQDEPETLYSDIVPQARLSGSMTQVEEVVPLTIKLPTKCLLPMLVKLNFEDLEFLIAAQVFEQQGGAAQKGGTASTIELQDETITWSLCFLCH